MKFIRKRSPLESPQSQSGYEKSPAVSEVQFPNHEPRALDASIAHSALRDVIENTYDEELTDRVETSNEDELMSLVMNIDRQSVPHIVQGEARERIVAILEKLGLVGVEQTADSIAQGIRDAKWLVETDNAAETLRSHPFLSDASVKPYIENTNDSIDIDFKSDESFPFDWSKLNAAASFGSWQGRGRRGEGTVNGNALSINKIFEFATRESKLPPISVDIFLTNQGPVCIAQNSHRAAAAILRNEDIGCHHVRIKDVRSFKA